MDNEGLALGSLPPGHRIYAVAMSMAAPGGWRRRMRGSRPMPPRGRWRRLNRIGIGTGACFGGDLTCLVPEGTRLGFLTA